VAIGVALASGCAATTMNVSSHVRDGVNLSAYRTYAWGPPDARPAADDRLSKDPYFQDYLEGAVEKQLAAKGIEHAATGTPDLLIHYHASSDTRIDVNRTEREYGYCQGADCDSWVVQYEAGTLVLDIIDARTNRLIWRGWAQDSVDALADRNQMSEKIGEAVGRMMARFPRP
jgi:hypothetical protein